MKEIQSMQNLAGTQNNQVEYNELKDFEIMTLFLSITLTIFIVCYAIKINDYKSISPKLQDSNKDS